MSAEFDPYYRWLGIPPEEQPPHHYRLFGLALFESDREVIDAVASRHIAFLQQVIDGPHVREAQRLLSELAVARRCLLDAPRKAAYDTELREQLAEARKPPVAAPPAAPPPPARQVPPPAPPAPAAKSDKPDFSRLVGERPASPTPAEGPAPRITAAAAAQNSSGQPRRLPGRRNPWWSVAAVGVAVLAIAVTLAALSRDRQPRRHAAPPATKAPTNNSEPPASTAPTATEPPAAAAAATAPPDAGAPNPSLTRRPLGDDATPSPAQAAGPPPPETASPAVDWPPLAAASQPAFSRDGLLLWLDAADSATISVDADGRLREWRDKSGRSLKALAPAADVRPARSGDASDDRSLIRFDGTRYLELSGTAQLFTSGNQFTFVIVAAGPTGTLLSNGPGDAGNGFAMNRGAASFRAGGRDLHADGDSGRRLLVRSLVAREGSLQWYLDGRENAVLPESAAAIRSTGLLRIGCWTKRGSGPQDFFQGELAELLLYDRPLSDEERTAVEQSLREKWQTGGAEPEELAAAGAADAEPPAAAGDDGDSAMPVDPAPSEPAPTEPAAATVPPAAPSNDGEADALRNFVVLAPREATASAGARLQILADGSVLAEGDAPEGAEYRLRIDTDLARITALRLEALPHETLPGKGPGRGLGGAFSLAEFRATVAPRNGTGTPAAIQWQGVLAGGDRGAERTIDGQAATSWTVRRRGESVALTFLPRQPIGGDGGSTLEIALVQRETLGCFRLSATTAAAPAELRPPDQPAGQPATELLVRYVNLGGDGFQDEAGNLWVKSQDYDGTTFGHESGSSAGKGSQVYPGKPWAESAIRGLIAFRAVVPNGTYEVGLYFCEQWTKNADSRRYYAVFERDTPQQILRRFHAPGLTGPYLYTEPRVVVKDGILDLDFRTVDPESRVVLNGIHIRQLPVKAGPGGR